MGPMEAEGRPNGDLGAKRPEKGPLARALLRTLARGPLGGAGLGSGV